ncbi:MAG: LysR family transcriptional regulator [Nocardioides sp.]
MDLRQLSYVVAVAEYGGFTRAAERCFVVQSALSHQIARLERELGARLFHRTSRHVSLTAAGRAFLPAARQCLDAAARARAEVAAASGEIRGRLSIGVIPTVAAIDAPSSLRAYHDRHPQVLVSLTTGGSDELVDKVIDGRCDIAFIGLPTHVTLGSVHSHLLASDRHVAVMAPDHPLAGAAPLKLRRLADQAFIDFPKDTPGRAQSDRAFAAAGLRRDVTFEVLDASLMARLIRERLGIALLPSTFAAQLPDLVSVTITEAPSRNEHVIWSLQGPSPAAAAFLDQLNTSR